MPSVKEGLCPGLIVDQEYEWFADLGRVQVIGFQGAFSDAGSFFVAVPQGSILGPLLFVLHVNDLPNVTRNCNTLMYADGTLLVNCITYIYWNI